ncbi:MAG TPA: hypothetical protein PLP39_01820 [Flavobacterium lutivivi]|nr:hypothetical protein [Flavobacterium lutivivi]
METFTVETQKTTGFSTYLAIGSFSIGTILLMLHLIFPHIDNILFLGFFYVLFTFLINAIVFLNLAFQFIIKPESREDLAIKMLIMLANIPITIFYIYLVFHIF